MRARAAGRSSRDEAVEGRGVDQLVGVAGADGGEAVGEAAEGRGEGLDLGIGGGQDLEQGRASPSIRRPAAGGFGPDAGIKDASSRRRGNRARTGRGPIADVALRAWDVSEDRAGPSCPVPSRPKVPRRPHPRRRRRSMIVPARSSGSWVSGAFGLPTLDRPGSGHRVRFRNAPFPLTAAGPRRRLTGFPSTGTSLPGSTSSLDAPGNQTTS